MGKNLRIILGGTGFIGTHLFYFLSKKHPDDLYIILDKNDFKCVNNLNSEKEILNHLNDFQNKKILIKDLIYEDSIQELLNVIKEEKDIDKIFIYHLAAIVGVKNIIENELYLTQENKINFNLNEFLFSLRNLFSENDIILTYFSTSEVYGNISYMKEDVKLMINDTQEYYTRQKYGVIKLFNEFYFKEICKKLKIYYKIIRPFNIVAPEFQRKEFVISMMIDSALNNNYITIYGDGLQSRIFTHVDDCVKAVYLISENYNETYEKYNIGTPFNLFKIKDVAEMIKHGIQILLNKEVELKYIDTDQKLIGQKERIPDLSRMLKLHNPKIKLKDIIKEYIEKYSNEF